MHRPLARLVPGLLLLLVPVAVACGGSTIDSIKPLDLTGIGPHDLGGPMGDPDLTSLPAPVDLAGAPTRTVTGTSVTNYVNEAGEKPIANDLTKSTVAAFASDGKGGTMKLGGSGLADGSFTVAGVPSGPYWLQLGTLYVYTTSSTVDFGNDTVGRPDAQLAGVGTQLSFDIGGISPWSKASDGTIFAAMNSGAYFPAPQYMAQGAPAEGDTSLHFTNSYLNASSPYLVDASKGDKAVYYQLAAHTTDQGVGYTRVDRFVSLPSLTMQDGAVTHVMGTMSPVAPNESIAVMWKRSLFEMQRTAMNPGARFGGQLFNITAQPGGLAHGAFAYRPLLLNLQPPTGMGDVNVGTLDFGNPFPVSWGQVGFAESSFAVDYQLAGASTTSTTGFVYIQVAPSGFATVQPLVTPVTGPQVDGVDVFNAMTAGSLTPTLSWSVPAMGTASAVQINVVDLTVQNGQTTKSLTATLVVGGGVKSTALPPGILQSGHSYYFRIRAFNTPIDLTQHPLRGGLPLGLADVLTGVVKAP